MAVLERILPDSKITAGCWQALNYLSRTSAFKPEPFQLSQHLLGHNTISFILKYQKQSMPKPGKKGRKIGNYYKCMWLLTLLWSLLNMIQLKYVDHVDRKFTVIYNWHTASLKIKGKILIYGSKTHSRSFNNLTLLTIYLWLYWSNWYI